MKWLKDIVWEKLSGVIVVWSGAAIDIPEGWALCDGTQCTPDLRNRFIVGAGDTYNPGDSGGQTTHNHSFTSDPHYHNLLSGTGVQAGVGKSIYTSEVAVTGTTDATSHLPPYYALCYIMKL